MRKHNDDRTNRSKCTFGNLERSYLVTLQENINILADKRQIHLILETKILYTQGQFSREITSIFFSKQDDQKVKYTSKKLLWTTYYKSMMLYKMVYK